MKHIIKVSILQHFSNHNCKVNYGIRNIFGCFVGAEITSAKMKNEVV